MSHTINGDFVKSSREYVDFAKCRQNAFFRILQSLSDVEKNDIKIRMSGGNWENYSEFEEHLSEKPQEEPVSRSLFQRGRWHPRHVQVEELRVLLEVLAPDAAARGVVAERVDVGEEGGARRRRA